MIGALKAVPSEYSILTHLLVLLGTKFLLLVQLDRDHPVGKSSCNYYFTSAECSRESVDY